MPRKNIPLLKRLRTRFLRMQHSQHFRMKQIAIKTSCGAAGCLIYHTLIVAGYKSRLKPDINFESYSAARCDYLFSQPDGKRVLNESDEAQHLLGLTNGEAHELFHDWKLKTPKDAAKRIEQIITEAEQQ